MKHILLSRTKFDDDILFEKYFDVTKKIYIPSLINQTNKNFEIGFIINSKHKKYFEDNLPKEIKITFFETFENYSEYVKKENFEIQTRHDIDDGMESDYIETIQRLYETHKNKYEKFIIHAQPIKIDLNTNKKYYIREFHETYNSMFLSLCQKKCENTVFDRKHRLMYEITNNIIKIQEPKVFLIYHGNNSNTGPMISDILIDETIKNYDLSVIIPTFNNVQYIDESVNSILKSIKNLNCEILVGIDNCEKTKNYIIKNLSKFPKNIRFFYFHRNVGPYIIRNSLVKISNSENIFFFDSDDIASDNLISVVYNSLQKYDVIRYKFWNFYEPKSYKESKNLEINGFYSLGQFGIKKEKFLNLNGFEPWVCGADTEFQFREKSNRLKTINIDEPLIFRRKHQQNLTIKSSTGHNSKLRNYYTSILNKKRKENNFKPLKELPISSFSEIKSLTEMVIINTYDNIQLVNTEESSREFSIIIPTYKNTKFIDNCLDSIIKNIGKINCEVLIGVDNCEETLNHLKNKVFDNRIRIFYFTKNVGPYVIKNTLSDISNSKILIFFDSDDIMHDNMIEKIMSKQKDFDVVKPMYLNFTNESEINTTKILKSSKYGDGVFSIKKDILLSMNGFEGWLCEADTDFMTRLYKNNRKIALTSDVVFFRRIHSNSLTQRKDTGIGSALRSNLNSISRNRKHYGPLPNLIKSSYYEVYTPKIDEVFNEQVRIKIEQNKETVKLLTERVKKHTTNIDYDFLNHVINKKEVYNPNTSKRPIRENIPVNRNDMFELKKGSLADISLRLSNQKPKRRTDNTSPNPRNKKGGSYYL